MLLRLRGNSEQPLGPFSVSQGSLFRAQDSVSLFAEKGAIPSMIPARGLSRSQQAQPLEGEGRL